MFLVVIDIVLMIDKGVMIVNVIIVMYWECWVLLLVVIMIECMGLVVCVIVCCCVEVVLILDFDLDKFEVFDVLLVVDFVIG